ncbi:hypothetical protein ACNKHV_22240 [Shigella flexneri]
MVKFWHEGTTSGGTDCHDQPSSFLAISESGASRFLWREFSPKTMSTGKNSPVGCTNSTGLQNSNAVVIQYQDKPYVRLNGGEWCLRQ